MRLAQRAFDYADQMRFASVAGDRNPMHVDALQARRTQAGAPVVHGIHLLIWAFDSLAAALPELPPLRSFVVQFYNFVHLEETVELELIEQAADVARLNINVENSPRSRVTLQFGEPLQRMPDWPATSLEPKPTLSEPMNLDFEQMAGRSGLISFPLSPENAAALFPFATKWLGAQRICALAATTYLIGMVCPGLYSIYRELSINILGEPAPRDFLAFRVIKTDARFRLVEQEVYGGGMTGLVKSFIRTPPVRQASMDSLANVVGPTDFAGSVVLIIGGSRGLGELTAKVIATGGGRVIITWQTGKDDAERVADEIRLSGGACETHAYDSRKPAIEQLASLAQAPTHAYYFATPAIFRPQSEIFSTVRLKEFLAIYVDGFWQLSQALRILQPKLSLFFPSSVSVTERPRGMTEYTMAKAAGEVLCADMNVSQAPLRVIVKRLPRLPTDQTASNTVLESAHPLETMLPIIREVQAWPMTSTAGNVHPGR